MRDTKVWCFAVAAAAVPLFEAGGHSIPWLSVILELPFPLIRDCRFTQVQQTLTPDRGRKNIPWYWLDAGWEGKSSWTKILRLVLSQTEILAQGFSVTGICHREAEAAQEPSRTFGQGAHQCCAHSPSITCVDPGRDFIPIKQHHIILLLFWHLLRFFCSSGTYPILLKHFLRWKLLSAQLCSCLISSSDRFLLTVEQTLAAETKQQPICKVCLFAP